ncbi:MAG: YlxR family protein [Actinomycetota bacterium]
MNATRAPERTCVGCRERAPKGALLRVVARADGLAVDATGEGRGAYVHPSEACLAAAIERRAFARALRTGVAPEGAARLGAVIREHLARERSGAGTEAR